MVDTNNIIDSQLPGCIIKFCYNVNLPHVHFRVSFRIIPKVYSRGGEMKAKQGGGQLSGKFF